MELHPQTTEQKHQKSQVRGTELQEKQASFHEALNDGVCGLLELLEDGCAICDCRGELHSVSLCDKDGIVDPQEHVRRCRLSNVGGNMLQGRKDIPEMTVSEEF
jgi:hypothetical protein